jgi:hypothetical protein
MDDTLSAIWANPVYRKLILSVSGNFSIRRGELDNRPGSAESQLTSTCFDKARQ